MNIVEPIFAQCRNAPSELALCAPGTELNLVSYARLQRSVNNICHRIIAAGIAPRSRVGVVIEDPILHALVIIALTRLGVVSVSASDRSAPWPIALDAAFAAVSIQSNPVNTLIVDASWIEGDDRPIAEKHLYRAAPDELCRIVLTPAGDAQPAAIGLTHGMIATRLDRQKLFFGPAAPFCDRTHLDLPLTTALGFQVMLGTLWRGGALTMTWDVRRTLAALAAYKVQNMIATPQNLLKFGELAESHDLRSNLVAVFSAGSMTADSSERVRARLCSNLTLGYVAGDATMVAAMPAQFASAIPGAVGYPLPDVMVEVVDDEDRALPRGEEGKLRIRSEYGVTEYLEGASATQRDFRDGWFYPATRGQLTADKVLVVPTTAETRFTMPTPWVASVRLQ